MKTLQPEMRFRMPNQNLLRYVPAQLRSRNIWFRAPRQELFGRAHQGLSIPASCGGEVHEIPPSFHMERAPRSS